LLAETSARIYQITWRRIPEEYGLDYLTVENKEHGVFTGRRFRLLGQRIQSTFFTSKKLLFLTMSEWYIPDFSVVQVPRPAVFLVCRLSLVSSCHQEPMEILFLGHSHLQSAM